MSDDHQPEEMRSIPDGGLKDAMPGWLKRPPAWRNMPSAEQRHERTLPEPDTSTIDPKTLVDIDDLPRWLQSIAARGDVPVPEPDKAVGHALELLQAASSRARVDAPQPDVIPLASEPAADAAIEILPESPSVQEVGLLTDEPATNLPQSPGARTPRYLVLALAVCAVLIVVLAWILLSLL